MADTMPNALEVADKLDHLACHLVSDRESVQQAAELIRAQHAALAASPPNAALADGWVVVPRNPTPAMSKAAADAWLDCGSRLCLNKAAAAVRAGIAATPPTINASGEECHG